MWINAMSTYYGSITTQSLPVFFNKSKCVLTSLVNPVQHVTLSGVTKGQAFGFRIKKDLKRLWLTQADSYFSPCDRTTFVVPYLKHPTSSSPLGGGVRTVEGVLELNHISVFLFQLPVMLHVILDQLCQSGKLLPTIKVIVVSCVLDFNVGDGSISPAWKNKSTNI